MPCPVPPRKPQACRAVIRSVEEDSPAWCVGLEPGMALVAVNGKPLRDIIDWQWEADGFEVEITTDEGDVATLEREMGESWGIEFDDCLFDSIIECRNACTFCFMRMLPEGLRNPLTLRDDDYRLSFLQGNFVTLTNMTDEDVERVITCGLSPLHVSLHAVSPDVREQLMGRNAARGMEVLEQLLSAGIEVHVQLVVCPGINDGAELVRTLGWVEAHPGVLSCGIVPLGYTRFQDRFTRSFSDDADAAAEVIDMVREFQEDSRNDTRVTKYHISDEFYLAAGFNFPPAEFYDGYPQFQDGIGMVRSYIDDFKALEAEIVQAANALDVPATLVTGEGFGPVLERLISEAGLSTKLQVLKVHNDFFGGNTDVAGLLTASDITPALKAAAPAGLVLLPNIIFNADGLTLDDHTLADIEAASSCSITLMGCNAADLLEQLREESL